MMTHPYDDIEAYALGSLEPEQAQRVIEHADSCPTCAVLMADAMATVHAMLGPQTDRPLDQARVLQRLPKPQLFRASGRAESRTRRSAALPWTLATAALAACLGLLLWNAQLGSRTITVPIASLVHSHFTHHALRAAAAGVPGSAKVIQAVNGQWLYVVADGLKPRTTYELSEIVGGQQRAVGKFSSNDRGDAAAYWEQEPKKIDGFAIAPASDAAKISKDELRWP